MGIEITYKEKKMFLVATNHTHYGAQAFQYLPLGRRFPLTLEKNTDKYTYLESPKTQFIL